jgi:Cu+-exporting ATPase
MKVESKFPRISGQQLDNAIEKDPVCGMDVAKDSPYQHVHADTTYRFCSQHCLHKFHAAPDKYLAPSAVGAPADRRASADSRASAQTGVYTCPMDPEVEQEGPGSCPKCGMALEPMGVPVATTTTEYTCPMHPEVVSDKPGACPKCGMALEPRTVEIEEDKSELIDMSRRFWLSVVLAFPVFLSVMAAEFWPETVAEIIQPRARQWAELLLATPVVLWGGWPFFVRGWQSVVSRHLNMFTLIALGVGIAWVYSLVATILPGIFPASVRNEMGVVPVYFEAAAVITALVLLGQVLA